jgi:membrane associated rhomboid family serine protease
VLDLKWQTTSWWANGIAASATKYAAITHRRVTASRGRVGATPDYTAASPGAVYRSRILDSMIPLSDVIPSRTVPVVTIALISVNVFIFLYEQTLPEPLLRQFVATYALIPAWFSVPALFTSQFLHGGWMHIISNMLYLWIFGDNVEDRLGHVRYLVFYLGAGAAAAILQTLFDPFSSIPMVGASGAIAGVMGAYFVLYPYSRVLTAVFLIIFFDIIEVPAVFFLGLWFLLQLLSGVGSLAASNAGGGIAFWAHIGGFVAGVLIGLVLRSRDDRWAAV